MSVLFVIIGSPFNSDKPVKEIGVWSDIPGKPEGHLQEISQPLTSMDTHGMSEKGVKADENTWEVCDLLKEQG